MMKLLLALLSFISVSNCVPALATSFIERPLADTTREAETIVRGSVGRKSVREAPGVDGKKRNYTYYELQVVEVFKGPIDPRDQSMIRFREIGGERNGVGLAIAGAAQFDTGEDVILMLGGRNPDESYDLIGLMTGKFGIEKDEEGKEYLKGSGTSLLTHPVARPYLAGAHGETSRPRVSLDDFRALIRDQAAAKEPSLAPQPAESAAVQPGQDAETQAGTGVPSQEAPDLQKSGTEGEPQDALSLWVWLGAGIALLGLIGKIIRAWSSGKR